MPDNSQYKKEDINESPSFPDHGRKESKNDSQSANILSRRGMNSSQAFSSVDGAVLDDAGNEVKIDSGHIIDNNDYVNFGDPVLPDPPPQPQNPISPEVGDCVLMVLGRVVSCGSVEDIEIQVKNMAYGEHPAFKGPVDIKDIIVLKRVGIKFGVFLDE